MGRISNEAKAERAREVLIKTIASIDDLEPTLGGKWKQGMLDYYCDRLAELVLFQSGFNHPSANAMYSVKLGIMASLGIKP